MNQSEQDVERESINQDVGEQGADRANTVPQSQATAETPESVEANTVPGPMAGNGDSFIRKAINAKLDDLREECAIELEALRHAQDPASYWGTDSGTSTYWADLKARCALERAVTYPASLQRLSDFIAEHRPLMGEPWIGNDHGRLCWAPFLGGLPIGQHYCQAEESHAGPHWNALGSWPIGVTNGQQWHRLLATLPAGANGLEAPAVEPQLSRSEADSEFPKAPSFSASKAVGREGGGGEFGGTKSHEN